MDKNSLLEGLTTTIYGRNLIYHDVIDSTNTYALQLIQRGNVEEGTVIIAGRQTNGRGTSGNKWESATPEGLLVSIIIHDPDLDIPLSLLPAVAAASVLCDLDVDVHLKWPNDILVGTKKIGGILCESAYNDKIKSWVIGFGLNVNQSSFPVEIVHRAASLFQIKGEVFRIEDVFQRFMLEFEKLYTDKADLIALWKNYTRMIGKTITVKRADKEFKAEVLDLSKDGYLKIRDEHGNDDTLISVSNLDIALEY